MYVYIYIYMCVYIYMYIYIYSYIYTVINIGDGNSVYGAVMSIGLFVTILNVMDTRFCNLLTNWREEEH